MKEEAMQMSLLLDYYGELLSQKQRTCFDLYYNQDLSLSEIAAELGVSRQGVHELLAGCIARDRRTAIALADIKAACERLQSIPDAKEALQEILRASASIKE